MARSRYPYLIKQRNRWFVRMIVPQDVQEIIGLRVFKEPTGHSSEHLAATASGAIVADLKRKIQFARDHHRRAADLTAEGLAQRYLAEKQAEPDKAQLTRLTDVIAFALKEHGHTRAEYARRVRDADYDMYEALRLLPEGAAAARRADEITGDATPLLVHIDRWKPHSGLKPRPLDQAISSIKEFDRFVGKPIQQIEPRHVQSWIDHLIDPASEDGLSSKTVARKMGEIKNYWTWLQANQIISEEKQTVRPPARSRPATPEEVA